MVQSNRVSYTKCPFLKGKDSSETCGHPALSNRKDVKCGMWWLDQCNLLNNSFNIKNPGLPELKSTVTVRVVQ